MAAAYSDAPSASSWLADGHIYQRHHYKYRLAGQVLHVIFRSSRSLGTLFRELPDCIFHTVNGVLIMRS